MVVHGDDDPIPLATARSDRGRTARTARGATRVRSRALRRGAGRPSSRRSIRSCRAHEHAGGPHPFDLIFAAFRAKRFPAIRAALGVMRRLDHFLLLPRLRSN